MTAWAAAAAGLAPLAAPARAQDASEPEALSRALHDYATAGYDVHLAGDEERRLGTPDALARLQRAHDRLGRARGDLKRAVERAHLDTTDELDERLVREVERYLEVASRDLRVIPREATGGGLLVVRVAERREVPERRLADRVVTYRVTAWDEVVVPSFERYRALRGDAPIALAAGRTIFLDRGAARDTARERVQARALEATAIGERAARGARLGPSEVKDLLRHRSLAGALMPDDGETTARVAAAILREEETRLAALFAALGERGLGQIEAPEDLTALVREATLVAVATGEPRYQLASALALTLARPDSPSAAGALEALRRVAGDDDLTALVRVEPAELQRRARAFAGR